jgi:hypothetical protein
MIIKMGLPLGSGRMPADSGPFCFCVLRVQKFMPDVIYAYDCEHKVLDHSSPFLLSIGAAQARRIDQQKPRQITDMLRSADSKRH